MVDRYIFPAVFYPPEKKGLDYCVVFPDLDVATQGETLEQALDMAKELLELTIFGLEEDGDQIPVASDPATLGIDHPGAFATLIAVNMPMVRAEMDLQYVRKTVTLPKWLNDLAENAGVNFSKTLQTALKLKLDSSDPPIYVSEKQEQYLPEDD
jgi:predicted RNase H-like HicB family nuclease/post-segregation antitoxin (ccd killing protein)